MSGPGASREPTDPLAEARAALDEVRRRAADLAEAADRAERLLEQIPHAPPASRVQEAKPPAPRPSANGAGRPGERARLAAVTLALRGIPRGEAERQLRERFGDVDLGAVLEEVYADDPEIRP
jgi:hypothetical protein